MSECCKSGFKWDGKAIGKVTKIANLDTYVTGDNKDAAVLIVHDVFGWTLTNVRILADHYAKEANVTVYLPDFFGGEVVAPDALEDEEKRKNFDLMAFIGRNSKEIRFPEIKAVAQDLKKNYKKVGAIGFCYGGWAVFQLGSRENKLVDAISTAHPSLLTKEEVDAISVPVQILSPEFDQMYTQELKDYTNSKIPALGVEYDYQYFPGLVHGFAARGDPSNAAQKKGLERAKNAVVHWFSEHLHESQA
ncbi:dienelactone hydrolase [Delphinella strobiligena]|nr:dienelactone hydrolase [Delphinella strobiligena]